MAAQSLDIPLIHGAQQQIDPKLMPQGALRRSENARLRKDGRYGKRNGYTALTAPASSWPHFVSQLVEQKLLGLSGELWLRNDAADWKRAGWLTRWLPGKETPAVAQSATLQRYGGTAYANGYVGVVVSDTAADLVICTVIEKSTGNVVARDSIAGTSVLCSRVVASGDDLVFVWLDGTAISHRVFDTATKAFGGTVAVGTFFASTGLPDCCEAVDNNGYFLVYQASATTLSVRRVNLTTGAAINSATITTSSGNHRPGIVDANGRVYVAWHDETGTTVRARSYTSALGGVSAEALLEGTVSSVHGAPVLCRFSSTQAMVFWSRQLSSARAALVYRTVSDAAVMGTMTTVEGIRVASKPFTINSQPYLFVANGEETELQMGYHLISTDHALAAGVTPPTNFLPHLSFAETRGSYTCAHTPSKVYLAGNDYLWGAPVVTSRATSDANDIGYSTFTLLRGANLQQEARQTAKIGGVTYIAGGELQYFDGVDVGNLGSISYPRIVSLTANTTGSLDDSSSYSYALTWEYYDAAGQRHQTEPSAPVSITLGVGEDSVDVAFSELSVSQIGFDPYANAYLHKTPTLVVWRTIANGSVYYRVPTAPVAAYVGGTLTDTASDATIADKEVLYIQGGILPNYKPPACRLICASKSRALIAGLADPTAYLFSKLHVPGLPLEFADYDGFRGNVPGDITAIATLDDVWCIFTADAYYLVGGEGPDNTGAGQFTEPRRGSGDCGCIDWRSVAEVPEGLVFQSAQGLRLMPRGFGTPVPLEQTEDMLATAPVVTSATVLPEKGELRLTVRADDSLPLSADSVPGATLVWDLKSKNWHTDIYNSAVSLGVSGTWDGDFVGVRPLTSDTDPVRIEGGFADGSSYIVSLLELGDLRPFALQGRGLVRRVAVLGEYRDNCRVKIEASYDGGQTYPDSATWDLLDLNPGQMIAREWGLPRIQIDEVRFRLSDVSLDGASEGFVFNALSLQIEPRRGARRFASAERA